MKVCLIDADSKIPNIPLMKLSTFHKSKGDEVSIFKANLPYYPTRKKKAFLKPEGFDKYYCSVVFDGNKEYIQGDGINFGGTGYDLETTLPDYIEQLEPDYSLYQENDTSYGFISRGCIRKCYFCIVHKKEGGIKQVADIDSIVRHGKVKFLDNNFLALPNHKELLRELIAKNIKCQFNQGLDIRLVDEENSELLSRLNYLNEYIFAFDDWSYLQQIERKLELMKWRKDWRFKFFVYCHPDMELSNIINRIEYLKGIKCLPYLMRNIVCWQSLLNDFYVDLASWCNQPNLIKKMEFDVFMEKRHKKNFPRINRCTELYYSNKEALIY